METSIDDATLQQKLKSPEALQTHSSLKNNKLCYERILTLLV